MFGGFGGLPRKPGDPQAPALGAVQGNTPVRIITPSTLGQVVTGAPPPHVVTPATLGAVTGPRWPKGPRRHGGTPVAMRVPAGLAHLKLSILILTLSSRASILGRLIQKLEKQINALSLTPEIEVLIFEDNKEYSVGTKRTRLLTEARGEFVVFIDDDDDISDDYVHQFIGAIRAHPTVDCIGMRGVITTNGSDPRQVVYSLKNSAHYEEKGVYYRPPCHLTPIRRTIAAAFPYIDASFGEDSDWAMRVLASGSLKSEVFVDKVLYYYQFSPSDSETQNRFKVAEQGSVFHIVILSARAANLRRCLASILENEPTLPKDRIIVVDDGARIDCGREFPGVTWVNGQRPFIFSRNANLGIKKAPGDVILLNDDARLATKFGFSSQSFATRARSDIGICSAAIDGYVGNPAQKPGIVAAGLRIEQGNALAFISVYITREALTRIGLLDERFVGYGYEDNDYCLRSRKAGFHLAVYDGCIVEHGVSKETSTYRSKPDISDLMEMNRGLYKAKWPNDA